MDVAKLPEILELHKYYEPLKRKAWLPVVEECEPNLDASRFGGFPWLEDRQKWPSSDKTEMTLTFQIKLSDLPDDLPIFSNIKDGFLQLFRNEENDDSKILLINTDQKAGKIHIPEQKANNKVIFTEDDSNRLKQLNLEKQHRSPEALKLFEKLQKSYKSQQRKALKAKKIKTWKQVVDYPSATDIFDKKFKFPLDINKFIEEIAETYDLYEDDIADYLDATYKCHAGDKIGGYPLWTQNIKIPSVKKEKMIYLLQLDGETGHSSFKIDGTGHLFYLPSDPHVMKFIWAST